LIAANGSDELAVISQILRSVQRLEDQHGQFKLNSMTNMQPMTLTENWGDVIMLRTVGDQTCGGVLDCLQPYRCIRPSAIVNRRQLQ